MLSWLRATISPHKRKCLLKGCTIIKMVPTGFLQNYTTCLEVIAARAAAGIACMVLKAANNFTQSIFCRKGGNAFCFKKNFFAGKAVRRFIFFNALPAYRLFNFICTCIVLLADTVIGQG